MTDSPATDFIDLDAATIPDLPKGTSPKEAADIAAFDKKVSSVAPGKVRLLPTETDSTPRSMKTRVANSIKRQKLDPAVFRVGSIVHTDGILYTYVKNLTPAPPEPTPEELAEKAEGDKDNPEANSEK